MSVAEHGPRTCEPLSYDMNTFLSSKHPLPILGPMQAASQEGGDPAQDPGPAPARYGTVTGLSARRASSAS